MSISSLLNNYYSYTMYTHHADDMRAAMRAFYVLRIYVRCLLHKYRHYARTDCLQMNVY